MARLAVISSEPLVVRDLEFPVRIRALIIGVPLPDPPLDLGTLPQVAGLDEFGHGLASHEGAGEESGGGRRSPHSDGVTRGGGDLGALPARVNELPPIDAPRAIHVRRCEEAFHILTPRRCRSGVG